jgi:hypothetical protein
LTAFGKLYQQFHDANRRGPTSWQELETYAAQTGSVQVVQSVQQSGCEVAWGTNFTELPMGRHQFILAHRPEDLLDGGGFVLFASGSVERLTAQEIRMTLDFQDRTRRTPSMPNAPTAAVPPSDADASAGGAVTLDTPLRPGQRLWKQFAGVAEEVEVLELLPGDFVRVRSVKWGRNFDHVVPRSILRLPAGATGQSASAGSPAPQAAAGGEPRRLHDFAYERRQWTDAAGKYQVTAQLVDYKDGQVTLKREDGGLVTLPIEKLSREDQLFLQSASKSPGGP